MYVLISPWSRVLVEMLTGSQLVKEFPHFMYPEGSLKHSQVPRHLSLSWATSIEYMYPASNFLKIHLNIILLSTPGSSK